MHQQFIDLQEVYDLVRRDFLYNIVIEFGIPIKPGKGNKNVSE